VRTAAPRRELLARGLSAARKGLELDPESASSHMMVAVATMFMDWDLVGGMKEVRQALELGPNDADVFMHAAICFIITGRKDEAVAAARRALEMEPVNFEINNLGGSVFYGAGDYDGAISQFQKTLELDANSPGVYISLSLAYEAKGSYPEAVAARKKALTLAGADPSQGAALARAFADHGMRGVYLWQLEMLKKASPGGVSSPTQQATLYALLGQKQKAFEMLEKAYEQRDDILLTLLVSHRFHSLRSDARFQELLRKMNFPEK